MTDPANDRPKRGTDRRRYPRGGRREGDRDGYAPLVFVIDVDAERREQCEIGLLQLRFAVASFTSVDRAVSAMVGLRPDAVVVCPEELDNVTGRVPAGRDGKAIPIVPLNARDEALIEALRMAFRAMIPPETTLIPE